MSKFTDSINRNWPDYVISLGTSHSCNECTNGDEIDEDDCEALDEGHFSWQECDSCGSRLGGDRFNAHAIHHEAFGPNAKQPDNMYHIEICVDCLVFHANGDEPEEENRPCLTQSD